MWSDGVPGVPVVLTVLPAPSVMAVVGAVVAEPAVESATLRPDRVVAPTRRVLAVALPAWVSTASTMLRRWTRWVRQR